MKRTVIVLQGKGNTGKSGTLRRACDILGAKKGVVTESFDKLGWKVDFKSILVVNGHKVGFYSQGDVANKLQAHILELRALGYEVIVCTARTKGQTVRAVESLQSEYRVEWLAQVAYATARQARGNSEMAMRIVETIERALGA